MGKKYYIILGVLALLFLIIILSIPENQVWKPTYRKKHKYPYGAEVTYKLLADVFGKENLDNNNASPYEYLKDNQQTFNIMYFASEIGTSEQDANAIMEFAGNGNHVLLAANEITGELAEKLGFTTQRRFNLKYNPFDSVSIGLTNPEWAGTKYAFDQDNMLYYLDIDSSKDATVLAVSTDNKIHFARFPVNKGFIYITSNPLLFTNFTLLHSSNQHQYMSRCLSYMPRQKTIWSEYYSGGSAQKTDSDLRFILSTPAFKWAYMIILFGILAFFIFQGKRRQRAIPVVTPPKNTTLEFVRTTGRLYFEQKNHLNLANKKIIFFLEKVRTKYYLSTSSLDHQFAENLASKSGVPQDEINQLLTEFGMVKKATSLSEEALLKLNTKLENFYKKASL